MTPDIFLDRVIDDGLDFVESLGGPVPTDDVRRFLLCVALQESGPELAARYQNHPDESPGPARGFWQFEEGGGVYGVLTHGASSSLAERACEVLSVVPQTAAIWRALEGNDLLAATFARLLLFTDTQPVPINEAKAWDCYCNRLWRPGKPHPEAWSVNWKIASITVSANPIRPIV